MQVTAYAHKDENNRFLVKKWNSEGRPELDFLDPNRMNETMEIELVRHGDLIRLEHITTRRNVHTHSEKAPLSKKQFQVTGYGEVGSDQNDLRCTCTPFHNLSSNLIRTAPVTRTTCGGWRSMAGATATSSRR